MFPQPSYVHTMNTNFNNFLQRSVVPPANYGPGLVNWADDMTLQIENDLPAALTPANLNDYFINTLGELVTNSDYLAGYARLLVCAGANVLYERLYAKYNSNPMSATIPLNIPVRAGPAARPNTTTNIKWPMNGRHTLVFWRAAYNEGIVENFPQGMKTIFVFLFFFKKIERANSNSIPPNPTSNTTANPTPNKFCTIFVFLFLFKKIKRANSNSIPPNPTVFFCG